MWDTAYWGLLRVRTTFDIFQNILLLYYEYGVLVFSGYGVLILFPSWSLLSVGTDTPYLLAGYGVLRALHPKWRTKVTAIEELKDLSSLALDELIGKLKVHEVLLEIDSEIYKGKKERIMSISLKAKKESSDDETSTSMKAMTKKCYES
ncbi:hypothetical protein Tco_0040202 [Tanacetum coccineum]